MDTSQEIGRRLRKTSIADKIDDKAVAEFRAAVHDYKAALAVHRLYLTPLIPFGGSEAAESDPHAAVITATAANLLLRRIVRIRHAPQASQIRDECLRWADAVPAHYKLMGEKVTKVVRCLNDGRDPFDIKWESE